MKTLHLQKLLTLAFICAIGFVTPPAQGETIVLGGAFGPQETGGGWLEEVDGKLVLQLRGGYYDMGYAHGRLLADEIESSIRGFIYNGQPVPPKENRQYPFYNPNPKQIQIYQSLLNNMENDPHCIPYMEEMQGMYQGLIDQNPDSHVCLCDIYGLVIIPDLGAIYSHSPNIMCEQMAVWGPATPGSKPYHARNFGYSISHRDLTPQGRGVAIQDNALLIVANPTDAKPFVSISFPGMVGIVEGMNVQGVSLAINDGHYKISETHYKHILNSGIPRLLRVRKALETANSLFDAKQVITSNGTYGWHGCLMDNVTGEGEAYEINVLQQYIGTYDEEFMWINWSENPTYDNGYEILDSPDDCQIDGLLIRVNMWMGVREITPRSEFATDEFWDMFEYVKQEVLGQGYLMDLDRIKHTMQFRTTHEGSQLQSVIYSNSDLDFHVANAVGKIEASGRFCKFYRFNLEELKNEFRPEVSQFPEVSIETIKMDGEEILSNGLFWVPEGKKNLPITVELFSEGAQVVEVMLDDADDYGNYGEWRVAEKIGDVWSVTFEAPNDRTLGGDPNLKEWRRWHRIKARARNPEGAGAIDIVGLCGENLPPEFETDLLGNAIKAIQNQEVKFHVGWSDPEDFNVTNLKALKIVFIPPNLYEAQDIGEVGAEMKNMNHKGATFLWPAGAEKSPGLHTFVFSGKDNKGLLGSVQVTVEILEAGF